MLAGFVLYNKARQISLNNMRKDLRLEINESQQIYIEAGSSLTYSPDDTSRLSGIPNEIKSSILSYPDNCEISLSEIDTSIVGKQDVTFKLLRTDRFGQSADSYQGITVEIVDTVRPDITLASNTVHMTGNTEALKKNVISVHDRIFGDYEFSEKEKKNT